MNKVFLFIAIVCLVVPFFLSFKSQKPRTFRRWTLAICFCVLLGVAFLFPSTDTIVFSGVKKDYVKDNTRQESAKERKPAVLCAASEVDLSDYSMVECAEVTASNFLHGSTEDYVAENAFDGSLYTCWQDGVDGNGEGTEITATFGENCNLKYIVFHNGQSTSEKIFKENGRIAELEIRNDTYTENIEFADENVPVVIKLDGWEDVSTVTFKINSVYPGSKYSDTCITEIVFYE